MENISTEYAGILHGNQLNPYSQYVSKEENGVVWHIKTITDEAYKNIILCRKTPDVSPLYQTENRVQYGLLHFS